MRIHVNAHSCNNQVYIELEFNPQDVYFKEVYISKTFENHCGSPEKIYEHGLLVLDKQGKVFTAIMIEGNDGLLFYRIGHQHQHLLALIKQQHKTQVTNSFLGKAACSNQLDAFHLTKMGGITQHVNEHELCNVAVSVILVIVFKGISEYCTLFCHNASLLSSCFTSPNGPYHVPAAKQTSYHNKNKGGLRN